MNIGETSAGIRKSQQLGVTNLETQTSKKLPTTDIHPNKTRANNDSADIPGMLSKRVGVVKSPIYQSKEGEVPDSVSKRIGSIIRNPLAILLRILQEAELRRSNIDVIPVGDRSMARVVITRPMQGELAAIETEIHKIGAQIEDPASSFFMWTLSACLTAIASSKHSL